jgi:hypothetical protein
MHCCKWEKEDAKHRNVRCCKPRRVFRDPDLPLHGLGGGSLIDDDVEGSGPGADQVGRGHWGQHLTVSHRAMERGSRA